MTFGLLGWGFILSTAGLITLISVLAQLAKNRSFVKCSESIGGIVAGKHTHHSKNNRHYSIDVQYAVNGVTYKRSVPVVLSEYNTLKNGDTINLKYKPSNPKKIIRADSLTDKNMKNLSIVAIVAAVVTVMGIALFFIA